MAAEASVNTLSVTGLGGSAAGPASGSLTALSLGPEQADSSISAAVEAIHFFLMFMKSAPLFDIVFSGGSFEPWYMVIDYL
jgi:hypothetical protein